VARKRYASLSEALLFLLFTLDSRRLLPTTPVYRGKRLLLLYLVNLEWAFYLPSAVENYLALPTVRRNRAVLFGGKTVGLSDVRSQLPRDRTLMRIQQREAAIQGDSDSPHYFLP
jgi:hypothetical protein